MLIPFVQLIFTDDAAAASGFMKESNNYILNFIRNFLTNSINTKGKVATLGLLCIFILISVFLKNVFLYLAGFVLNPIKNKVVNRLRSELYDKILHLPIGYFTEKRKGDLISRITNDITEVESSVVGALEGWIRDPLSIILTFAFLFYLSPQLTLFVALFVPVIGLIIGRIGRSLKKKSAEVAHRNADLVSTLDETLSSLRVIKAFNVEQLLRDKFFSINEKLLSAKNRIGYRKDLASPLSEFLGVAVFCSILYFGGRLILSGGISLEASAFIGYLAMFYNIINPVK